MSSWCRIDDVPPLPGQTVLLGWAGDTGEAVGVGFVHAQTGKIVCETLSNPTHWMFIPPVPWPSDPSL